MPLQNHLPTIDNRRYDDLVTEARTRVARYTPEWAPVWTDVNDSDPGITLVQVFAWLTELLTYRLNQVPELNYLKFLELLGIELQPAQPALTEITLPVLETHAEATVLVPPRTQVAAEADDGQELIVFETERALTALTARLAAVQSFDGYAYLDVSTENEEMEQGFEPFGSLANSGSGLMLGFQYDGLFPAKIELNLMVWVFGPTSRSTAYTCGLPETPVYASAQISWEYWNGQEWRTLSLLKDETQALTRSGHIYLKTPAKGEMKQAVIGAVTEARYWIRARLTTSQYERPPKLLAVRTNTVTAIQAQTVEDEVLGGSNGRPHQLFRLADNPVLNDSLTLEVDEGDGYQIWSPVADFFASSPTDRHYALNRTTGEIRFGDGFKGAIPVGNVDNPGANVVARIYRFGGGKSGNVAAGRLRTLLTPLLGLDENGLTNLQPAHSGQDEETLEAAKLRAPQSLKSKCRAVTEEDFEYLAKQVGNVKRAKALSLYHPDFPDVPVPGVVTVIVVPDSDQPKPTPSEGTLRTVCAYLNQRRLLTTELYVSKPTYLQVEIDVVVIAEDQADLIEVKQNIEATLLTYFHPLTGGEDGQGWPFGGDIYYSRVYQRIFMVSGVQRIERLSIIVEGETMPDCKDVPLPDGVLVYSTEHEIQINYDFA